MERDMSLSATAIVVMVTIILIGAGMAFLMAISCFLHSVLNTKVLEVVTTGVETFRYGETKHIDAPAMLEELPINCEVPDGKYKVKPIYRRSGESEWRFFRVGQSIRDYVMLTVVDGVQIYDIDVPFKYNEVKLGKTCVLLNNESYANLAVRGNGAYHEADISYKLIDEQTGDVVMEGEHTKVSLSMKHH